MFHFCFLMEGVAHMGASTVKWRTHDLCLVLSESDSKLCTNFEICEGKTMNISNSVNLQSQAIYDDQKNSNRSLHILEDGASGVQVGDIEQVIV